MKNRNVLVLTALFFLWTGTVFPVHALDADSVGALITKPGQAVRPQQSSIVVSPVIATKPAAFTISESNSAANLIANKQTESDDRSVRLKAYLLAKHSPLAGEATHFIEQADTYNLDWKFVAAISGVESTFGKFIPSGSYNGWGWGIPTGAQSGIAFDNWEEAIAQVSSGLRNNYINRGALTIEQIGRIYAASPAWSWKVRFFMDQIENFSPNSPEFLTITI